MGRAVCTLLDELPHKQRRQWNEILVHCKQKCDKKSECCRFTPRQESDSQTLIEFPNSQQLRICFSRCIKRRGTILGNKITLNFKLNRTVLVNILKFPLQPEISKELFSRVTVVCPNFFENSRQNVSNNEIVCASNIFMFKLIRPTFLLHTLFILGMCKNKRRIK